MSRSEDWLKRCFDIGVSGIASLVLLPLLAGVGLLVLLTSGRPVLFRQLRPGLHGKPFTLLKFRTMRNVYDPAGRLRSDADRLTRVGRFLRATSLDELPELWNVLIGDMSLVGPRPLLMEYLPLYSAEQRRRHDVRPGITGWAQINGRNALTWEEKFNLDLWYVRNRSFMLDLRILLKTLPRVLSSHGITQPNSATAERFQGFSNEQTQCNDGK